MLNERSQLNMYYKQYASKKQNSSKTKQKPKQTNTKQTINGNPSKLKKKKTFQDTFSYHFTYLLLESGN